MYSVRFPILFTDRLELNELREEHLDEFYPFAYFEGKPVVSKEVALEIIRRTDRLYKEGETINWGLFLEGKLIGTVGYYRGFKNNTGEVGYVLHHDYHRMGLMSEAVKRVLQYGRGTLKLDKVEAFTEDANIASVRLLEKLGFSKTTRTLDQYSIFELIFNFEA